MKTVHKFSLAQAGIIRLPLAFTLRHAADQLGTHCAWIELDTSHETFEREIIKLATGAPLPQDPMPPIFIGTVLESHGQFVWHYYARRA